MTGGSVEGNTLKLDSGKPEKVTYDYEASPGKNLSVTLNVSYKGEVTPIEQVTVSFDANGGAGTMEPVTVEKGSYYKLPDCDFTAPAGKEFKAWEVNGDEKTVGESITVNADTTVKAIWKDKAVTPIEKVTVNFDANGHGTAPAAQTIAKGEKAIKPTAPTENGYTFGGWFTEAACTNEYDFDTAVNGNITLYAKWTKVTDPVTPENPTNPGTPENPTVSDKASPKTGDDGMLYVYTLGLLAATSGMLILNARRKKKEQ